MSYTAISLFSGCGGFDLGLLQLGHRVIWANDKMEAASRLYQASFPDVEFCWNDVRKVKSFPNAQLVVGCYPCQGYSVGGAREKNRQVNELYLEFARALSEVQPYFFVSENVQGVKALFGGHYLRAQKLAFSQAGEHGYEVYPLFLNAKDFGVPQDRRRIFLVGVRKDINFRFEMGNPTHGPKSPSKQAYVTLRQAIGHLEDWPSNESEICWQGEPNWYYFSRNRRRDWNEVSFTILANKRHVPLYPGSTPLRFKEKDKWEFIENPPRYRRLSYKECALIQTMEFSDDIDVSLQQATSTAEKKKHSIRDPLKLKEPISLAKAYELIGNAVPPTLSKAVLSRLPHPDEVIDLQVKKLF